MGNRLTCYIGVCPFNHNKYAWECRANDDEIRFIISNYKHFCPLMNVEGNTTPSNWLDILKEFKELKESSIIASKLMDNQ